MNSTKDITILGAGSWGTALALVLGDNGHRVRLWGHNAQHMDSIRSDKRNQKYLPEIELPDSIEPTSDLSWAISDVEHIVIAVPTKAIREVLQKVLPLLNRDVIVTHVSKGIEPDTHLRISEIIEEELITPFLKGVVVLSGPSHAEEVGLRHPTTVTVSSKDLTIAEEVQDLFMNSYFRVYTNADVIGVEIGGALKNIIALAAGITDGLGYGDNAKAALITRGLAEIARLGTKMGANPLTFSGLTGIGDLIVTCTSVHSRNWRAGNMLGKGLSIEEVLDKMGMVVEGIRTTKAAYQLCEKYEVDMPITTVLYHVLFDGVSAKEGVDQLMGRMKKHEMEELFNVLDQKLEN
ncbi:glycerol-3-phosphate dehydrogenase [Bacillus coahuilensis p1.1.43]|uniref:Glycerol-3-phosphate dehydrogenase [NAD(P)+] n=1 Tax=Bacillus coahuilensis p1.1.43 TaxID=1150625 RepID=A0A147K8Y4_9BACI|nr:NAD(P)H-dependent glycerol-3-phosphate dehydrogenase [Bacillus coahuilensis]KUP06585.1 glycerol-3-phosphate dehydrogenase [Bacillus coahuilensis p1.1.43]